ncbi:MAG: glycosyltransferase family 1 protein [Lagierella massiliensis]|nr:glycosyltransferase family 1 protein [Lagierella massiliensis]
MSKNIIFHIPFYADKEHLSGSNIRPYKMIKGFKDLGYNVDIVMGYGKERKASIYEIKNKIENGLSYDFCYSESSTMPTLLTEKNHIPKYGSMDFKFFKYLKSKGIKIGLFYRDIYWQFDEYKKNLSLPKRLVSTLFYKYDLKKYDELVDVLYLPNMKMKKYIPMNPHKVFEELPPAIDEAVEYEKAFSDELNLFYVGGLGGLYQLDEFFKAVVSLDFVKVTVCTRKDEWIKLKSKYQPYLNEKVTIIHEGPDGYKPYLEQADLGILYFKPVEYRDFAMPVKLFEYIKFKKPILAVKDSAVGDFVKKHDIGFVLPYSAYELKTLLLKLHEEKNEIEIKRENLKKIIPQSTWKARALKVKEDLTN